jgi:methionyl aminopeptidase
VKAEGGAGTPRAAEATRTAEGIVLKSPEEIAVMRRAGRVVAAALEALRGACKPGVATGELNELAERTIREAGAVPSFLGYRGFPASVCVSVNDEVVHGIPGRRRLEEGDIVGMDVGAIVEGYHADGAVTAAVGRISPGARRLVRVTREALERGIAQAHAGRRLLDIARAVQSHVERHGYAVVRDLVGHGIGREMHEPPQVPNFVEHGDDAELEVGMTLAIEPMVNEGDAAIARDADGWTFRTRDGTLSAHWEHTVAVGRDGPIVLTAP